MDVDQSASVDVEHEPMDVDADVIPSIQVEGSEDEEFDNEEGDPSAPDHNGGQSDCGWDIAQVDALDDSEREDTQYDSVSDRNQEDDEHEGDGASVDHGIAVEEDGEDEDLEVSIRAPVSHLFDDKAEVNNEAEVDNEVEVDNEAEDGGG